MPRRRLSLHREVLTSLQPAELESVAGAAPISRPHPVCLLSLQATQCRSCEFDCTYHCPTETCV